MTKVTRKIEVELHTGLWGSHTGEHTGNYVRDAIRETKKKAKTLTARTEVTNELITVTATGTEKQIDRLREAIRCCVITVEKVTVMEA